MDVWRRQPLRDNFKPELPQAATMYSVCIRLPSCLLERVLQFSGQGGVYAEPRSADAKEINVPKMAKANLVHLKQTTPSVIGLARVSDRMGLRTLSIHAESLHQTIRPGSTYLPQGPRQMWAVGPMPFGADRNSISKALRSLPWEVKVLQPIRTLVGRGTIWSVQAISDPPSTLVQMSHGEVVFTRQNKQDADTKGPDQQPVASPETLALCGPSKAVSKPSVSGAADPLTANDPWKNWSGPQTTGPAMADTLKHIETKVQEAVMAKLPSGPSNMEQDDIPDRVQHLEAQFQHLLHKQNSLEHQVNDTAAKHTAQLTSLQSQLQGHQETMNQNVSAMFEQQMAQIRGLLAKRPRDEHE